MTLVKSSIFWAIIIAALAGGAFLALQWYQLNAAHSTFENYYAFRGCVELVDKTADAARCKLKDGTTITIVQINSKWYLKGDGPGVW